MKSAFSLESKRLPFVSSNFSTTTSNSLPITGGFLNSERREKNYSALDVLLVIHIQAQGPNSKEATKNEGR